MDATHFDTVVPNTEELALAADSTMHSLASERQPMLFR